MMISGTVMMGVEGLGRRVNKWVLRMTDGRDGVRGGVVGAGGGV